MKKLPLKTPAYQYLEQAFKEWLDILGYAPATVYNMPLHAREFLHHLENLPADRHGKGPITSINQIEAKHFEHYYRHLQTRTNQKRGGGLSGSYLNKHLQALHKLADYLRQNGKLLIERPDLKKQQHTRPQIDILTVEQIRSLYAQTKEPYQGGPLGDIFASRDRAILAVFYNCGLRRNEGHHLDINDIDLDKQLLHVRKGKNYKQRVVPFNKTTSGYLQEYIYDHRARMKGSSDNPALFISLRGQRMGLQALALRLAYLQHNSDDIELQQKTLTLHTLRHSIATHLLQAGMGLEKISRFLGHSSLESTQIYTHLIEKEDAL